MLKHEIIKYLNSMRRSAFPTPSFVPVYTPYGHPGTSRRGHTGVPAARRRKAKQRMRPRHA